MDYSYKVKKINRVVDGDTLWATVDLGFNVNVEIEFRLAGINTPEVVGLEKTAGLASRNELLRLFALGNSIRVVSSKSDKYGRWLGVFYINVNGIETDVNQELIRTGFALPYDGKGPKPV
jgi:micrococcal nuclease